MNHQKRGTTMSYEQELALLRDTFQKSHVNLVCMSEADFYALREVNPLKDATEDAADDSARKLYLQSLEPYTMYKQTDAYRRT